VDIVAAVADRGKERQDLRLGLLNF